MVLPAFPPNIPYQARPKSPPFQFFSAMRDIFFRIFFSEFFSSKAPPPCIFLMFCDKMDVEKPQRVPPFSFSALRDFSAPGARASGPRRATRSIFLVCKFFKKKIRKIFHFRVL